VNASDVLHPSRRHKWRLFQEYCFNRLERELAVLSTLTLSDVLVYIRHMFVYLMYSVHSSVADPSVIRFFTPGSGMGKKSGSGIRIRVPDPG
jgi:hypothetical protein